MLNWLKTKLGFSKPTPITWRQYTPTAWMVPRDKFEKMAKERTHEQADISVALKLADELRALSARDVTPKTKLLH